MKTFSIYTLGCKVNLYESEFITHLFVDRGYKEVEFGMNSDVIIVNTCSVTNNSDVKSRKIIRRARKLCNILVVCGCYTQTDPILDELKIDILLGNKDKSKICDLVEEYNKTKQKIKKIYKTNEFIFENMEITHSKNTRAFVKIQDGCNNFCSFCIIPYVRGLPRSKKKDDVINEVTNLVNNGYKEIVLTGIHTGNYGKEINTNLSSLLEELIKIKDLKRIRISSIEITELDEDFMQILKNSKIIVDHMHIPLQSGSDKILKIMRRKYDTKYFYEKIKEIRNIRENMNITTDLIVGHPYEEEEDFNNSYEFSKKIGFSKIHVFPYSDRSGTKASSMDNKVDGNIKKERVKKIEKLNIELLNNYNSKFINKELEVLVEKNNIGHTSNFIEVIIEGEKLLSNKLYNVKIIKVEGNKVYGRIN